MEAQEESSEFVDQGWTARTICLRQAKKQFELLAGRYPDWPTFAAFCDAYEAAEPFGQAGGPSDAARHRLRQITAQARSEPVPLHVRPARLFVACVVGLTRLARLHPQDRAHRVTAQYFLSLCREDPEMLEHAAYHKWIGRTELDLTLFPPQLEVDEIQAMMNAAGAKFCGKIYLDYIEDGFGLGCIFPSLIEQLAGKVHVA